MSYNVIKMEKKKSKFKEGEALNRVYKRFILEGGARKIYEFVVKTYFSKLQYL